MPLEELPIHDQGISLHRKQINILLTKIYKHFQGEIFIFWKAFLRKKIY